MIFDGHLNPNLIKNPKHIAFSLLGGPTTILTVIGDDPPEAPARLIF